MNIDMLVLIHSQLVDAARLPGKIRPPGVLQRLEQIQQQMMEVLQPKPADTTDDDIPF